MAILGRLLGVTLLLAVASPPLAGCSSDTSNPTPAPPVYTIHTDAGRDAHASDASGKKPGSDAAVDAPSHAEGGHDVTVTPTPDATPDHFIGFPDTRPDVPVLTIDARSADTGAKCETDAGCWSCPPTTTPQFLNQCTGSQCSPFDNFQRLPNYDGGLPPLN